jgi:hypothetical protein
MLGATAERWMESLLSIQGLLYVAGSYTLYLGASLIIPILWPPIISYPWQPSTSAHERQQVVVLAGSFNPPHNGHLAMLEYLSKR